METIDVHLQAAVSVAPCPFLVVGKSGTIVMANAAAEELLGYASNELEGQPVEILVPGQLRRQHPRDRNHYMIKPEPQKMGAGQRICAVHKDGREIPVEISISPGPNEQIICAITDVSARQAVEAKLRHTIEQLERRARTADIDARRIHEHFKLFLKHAPAAIAMLDRHMRYLIVSDRWLQDYGLGERDIHGMSHYDLFPELPERWGDAHHRCLAGEVVTGDEDTLVRMDGRTEWLRWELHPWRASDGKVGGMLIFSEVITQRKLAEAALRKSYQQLEERVAERTAALEQMKNDATRANAQKSWFVAAASHDLRQPLQASLAYLSVLARKMQQPELEELCEKARQPLKAMGDILDVLLDISDLESGRVKPNMQDFPLNEMLERVVGNSQHLAQEKGLRLSCVATDYWVNSDIKLLERVIANFVTNAVRYTAKGLIGIFCEEIGGTVCISVTDTGIGIPADALAQIFEDHVQLGNPARDRRKGLGLGLSIAKRIADSLGHRISVHSEVGSGSSFTIELPMARRGIAAELPAVVVPPVPAAKSKPIVLLIDDDQDVADAMQMLLQSYGFECYRAAGRDSALAMLESGLTPGLVLCDYRLPGVNGIEVIRQVRGALNIAVPSILVTGDTGMTEMPADLEHCALLHKPVDVDQFFAVIATLGA